MMGGTTLEYKYNKKTRKYELSRMNIVIYDKKIQETAKRISETKNELNWSEQALEYGLLYDKNDIDGMISATAAHEIIHATDRQNIEDVQYNLKNKDTKNFIPRDVETLPEASEDKVLQELNQ